MQSLPDLPSITQLPGGITRVLGQNPSKYTLQSTNTYLLGPPSALLLLDTGHGIPSYIPLLRTTLSALSSSSSSSSSSPAPAEVAHILLSHWHADHVGGLSDVLSLLSELGSPPPRIWKFPLRAKDAEIERALEGLPEGRFLRAEGGGALHPLRDGQVFKVGPPSGPGEEAEELQVLHTPGHTNDSISLFLHPGRGGPGRGRGRSPVLFTFDTVLGHGTAVFERLGPYLASLEKCLEFLASSSRAEEGKGAGDEEARAVEIYPGHGEVVRDGAGKLREYVRHRLEREEQVLVALRIAGESESTAEELTKTIYASTIPEQLYPAATRGLLLHLDKLLSEGKVVRVRARADEGSVVEARGRLVGSGEGEGDGDGDGTTEAGRDEGDGGEAAFLRVWGDGWRITEAGKGNGRGGEGGGSAKI